jgi:hypothetical protein
MEQQQQQPSQSISIDTIALNETLSISIEEFSQLNQLKEALSASNIDYAFDKYDNVFMLKFLRKAKCNIKKAVSYITNYFAFVREYNVENISTITFPNNDKIKLFYPHGLHKTTNEGLPVLIQTLGDLRIDDINKLLPDKLLDNYIIKMLERLEHEIFPKLSKYYNKYIHSVFCIVDLKGLTTSLMSRKVFDFVYKQLTIVENYYPGMLGGLYFVNSGFIFRAVWSACKYFYKESTRKCIALLGFEYSDKLLMKVNEDNLPKFLGGNCNCEPYGCIFSDEGPWKRLVNDNRNERGIDNINSNNVSGHIMMSSNFKEETIDNLKGGLENINSCSNNNN